jgi:hypothetical protein
MIINGWLCSAADKGRSGSKETVVSGNILHDAQVKILRHAVPALRKERIPKRLGRINLVRGTPNWRTVVKKTQRKGLKSKSGTALILGCLLLSPTVLSGAVLRAEVQVQVILRPMVSRSVRLGAGPPSETHEQISLLSDIGGLDAMWRPP